MKAITGRAGLRKCSSGGNAATAWELKTNMKVHPWKVGVENSFRSRARTY